MQELPMSRGKGIIIAVNKWDAIEKNDKTIYEFTEKSKRDPVLYAICRDFVYFCSRQDSVCPKLFETIDMVIENQTLRVQTGVLNEIVTEAVAMQQPPSDKGKTTEDLLCDTGSGKTAYICYFCK